MRAPSPTARRRPPGAAKDRRGAEGPSARHEAEQLLDTLPFILIGLTPELRITRWNQMACQVFGGAAEGSCGRSWDETLIQWDWQRVREGLERCRAGGESVRIDDLVLVRAGGPERVLGLTIHPRRGNGDNFSGFTIIGADITERKRLEKQLSQAQKLRSIGQLAAGIAHEINTPIQYVGDNIRFLQEAFADIAGVLRRGAELLAAARTGGLRPELVRRLEEDCATADLDYLMSEIPGAIQHAQDGIERITRIVRALKDFAHPGREEMSLADVNAVIETTLTVARNEWKYVADLVTDFDRSLPPLRCLPAEINQVILNLIINAVHAIEDVIHQGRMAKGIIRIATRRLDGWVEIHIEDNGGGIPEDIRPRIFDPFFTTKEIGRGTGQGLAICYPVIVEKHSGRITFESEVGRGTTFTIHLPLSEGMAEV
jgi:PAS domain S-box-containing protein